MPTFRPMGSTSPTFPPSRAATRSTSRLSPRGRQVADLERRRLSSALESGRTGAFFLAYDGRIFSAPVNTGEAFDAGTPRPVVESRTKISDYDVAPDGQRFLLFTRVVDPVYLPLHPVAHWPAAIKP